MNNNWVVYKHTTPANKFYFGITNSSNLNKRWANGLGYRTQTVFFRAIVKYGWDNIKHEVIKDNLSLEEAIELETKLIKDFGTNVSKLGKQANGYNMTDGGDTIPSIFYQEDANYKKMMEKKVYAKTRISVDCYDLNKKFLRTYESIRAASKDLGIGEQSISKTIKGEQNKAGIYFFTKHQEELKETGLKFFERPVNQFDFYGNFLQQFNSCADASRYVNFGDTKGNSMIAKCAKGERASYKGYLWSYTGTPILFEKRRKTRGRKVGMYDTNGNLLRTFNSVTEAKNHVAPSTKHTSNLTYCLQGKRHTYYGYCWKYIEE